MILVKYIIILLFIYEHIWCIAGRGYIAYCPCMGHCLFIIEIYGNSIGRFGNQADHFLGALAFSKGLNRTLILPPWVEYRYGEPKSLQVPFDNYFSVNKLKEYHDVITMEKFMQDIAPLIWSPDKRTSFCYTERNGEEMHSCNAKNGNPFASFWSTFNIDFVGSEFYGPLNYDIHNENMVKKWKTKYPESIWPVLAFTGAPASFPVQKENIHLQKYVEWNDIIMNGANKFISENLSGGGFIGIHLRNGLDWTKACQHVNSSPSLFSSPQCIGYSNERGPLTMSMCLPDKIDIIRQIKKMLNKVKDIKYIFVASDSNHMIHYINEQLSGVKAIKLPTADPHLDLAILGRSNYFIGNCVSSFTAFVKRERDVRGLPSQFWSFSGRKKIKHDEF